MNTITKISLTIITAIGLTGCAPSYNVANNLNATDQKVLFGTIGGLAGGLAAASVTGGLNLAEGALIGGVAGGAIQALTNPQPVRPVTYYNRNRLSKRQLEQIYLRPNQQQVVYSQTIDNENGARATFGGIVGGAIVGGTIGSVANGMTFGQGAIAGAVVGGAIQAIRYANSQPQMIPVATYYQPASYRQPGISAYRRVQMARNSQYALTNPEKIQTVPYYYSSQAGGYIPEWGFSYY
ncbi:MAG: hypothetical protein AB7U85_09150 [Alphaproteobacteria bacterium]